MTERSNEWISIGDLAQWLGIPVKTIYVWNTEGSGPPRYRLGRVLRYRRSEVEAWLETRRLGVHREAS